MPAGYRLRQIQRADDRAAAPCEHCGHPISAHREYPADDPRYRPLLFRCRDCDCELER